MRKLYVKQKVFKFTDHYDVLDENNNPIYKVDQDFRFFGNSVNVSKYDGSKSFNISRGMIFLLPKYSVKFSDGNKMTIQQDLTFFRKKIKIISNDYTLELKGNIWDINFEVYNNLKLVGNIYKKFLSWSDTFVIDVYDDSFEEELLALLIVVDDILDISNNN